MTQLTLGNLLGLVPRRRRPRAPFVPGSATSEAAAKSMLPHLERLCLRVWEAIAEAGPNGLTCDEVEVTAGLSHQTASARVNHLMRLNLIRRDGTRATRSGRRATIWVARRRP